jgi:hypothetical protein
MDAKRWLIYRPVMDYEESEESYAVCDTQAEALLVVRECLEYYSRLLESLPDVPDDIDAPDWDEKHDERRAKVAAAVWPYGIDLSQDVPYARSCYARSGFLQARELPRLTPSLATQPGGTKG